MKKLYASLVSNMGLILLAVLAAGIWTSNIQDFLVSRSAPQASAIVAPSPSFEQLPEQERPKAPTPALRGPRRRTAEEILGITPQPSIRDSLKASRSQPSPSPGLSASDRIKRIEEFLKSPPVAPTPFTNPGATAICRDRTYSFSQNRRGTCSHHGGVAVWLK